MPFLECLRKRDCIRGLDLGCRDTQDSELPLGQQAELALGNQLANVVAQPEPAAKLPQRDTAVGRDAGRTKPREAEPGCAGYLILNAGRDRRRGYAGLDCSADLGDAECVARAHAQLETGYACRYLADPVIGQAGVRGVLVLRGGLGE